MSSLDSAFEKKAVGWLRLHSTGELEAIAALLPSLIKQKRLAPTELDIALDHEDNPDLVAQVVQRVERAPGYSRELRFVFCTQDECPACPHGPFWYSIRKNKRRGTRKLKFTGVPVFSFNQRVQAALEDPQETAGDQSNPDTPNKRIQQNAGS